MLWNTMKRDKELFVAKEAGKATGKDGKTKVPPWRQPRGKSMVSLVNSHTNATRIGWHLWDIDSKFAPGLPPGWLALSLFDLTSLVRPCSFCAKVDEFVPHT